METSEIKKILVVDQGTTTRKLLVGRLRNLEYETVEAGTQEEIQTALAGQTFDLIVSELKVPGLDKRELFQKFQALRSAILVFTDKPPAEDDDHWKIAQIKGVFHKSQRTELLEKTQELLGGGAENAEEKSGEKHILLIEDSPTIRNFLRKILQNSFGDCVIREASEGREALSEMSNKKVDFIITDLQMPGMDGETFLKILHSNPLLKNKPVIVLSSSISSELREKLKLFESVRLLAKPSSAEEIAETVRVLLGVKASA